MGEHIYFDLSGDHKDIRINNNLFYQNESIEVKLPGESLMNVASLNASAYGEANIEGNPLFVNVGTKDFSIPVSSPAKDSGRAATSLEIDVYDRFFDTFGVTIERDLNQEIRPQGSVWDIGAYEYVDTGPDTTPPTLTSIASSTTDTAATITWTTNESATSTVDYGLTTGYGTASSSAITTTSHSFTLTGLATSTTYHFKLSSWDAVGNLATSSDYTFVTTYTPVDISAPTITSVASSTTDTTATITWTTNESATSTVDYGLTTGYGTASSSAITTTSHSFTLTGLATSTTYHFKLSSWDAVGNLATSSDYTFVTTDTPIVVVVTPPVSSGGGGGGGGSSSWTALSIATTTITAATTKLAVSTTLNTHSISKNTRNLKPGNTGSDVLLLQLFLNEHGFNVSTKPGSPGSKGYESTYFGMMTKQALIRFQKANKIFPADGYLGSKTKKFIESLDKLNSTIANTSTSTLKVVPQTITNGPRDLTVGSRGEDVKSLQKFLNKQGFPISNTPGDSGSKGYESTYFGVMTKQALIRFQRENKISPADGYYGVKTRKVVDLKE